MEDIDVSSMQPNKKAKTHKGKQHLDEFLPKLIEDPKKAIFINTKNSGEIMRMAMNELVSILIKSNLSKYLLRKEFSKKLNQKNEINSVFINKQDVEFFCEKNNTSLFTYTSDMKKKEMNLVMGCLFNKQILDAFEFEVINFIPMEYFKETVVINSQMKPVLIFQGEIFESDYNYERLKKFFIDYFKLYNTEGTIISQLKRVMIFSCDNKEKIIKIRNYQVNGDITEGNLNNIELKEIGPSFDLKERKFELADDGRYKTTLKQPRALLDIKKKNIETNSLGEKRGRLHMTKQNLNAVSLRKYKKLRQKSRFNKSKGKDSDNNLSIKEE